MGEASRKLGATLSRTARVFAGVMSMILVAAGLGAAGLILHAACVVPTLDTVVGGSVMMVLCVAVAYSGYAVGAIAHQGREPGLPEARQLRRRA